MTSHISVVAKNDLAACVRSAQKPRRDASPVSTACATTCPMPVPAIDDREVLALANRAGLTNALARLMLLVSRCLDAKMQLALGGAVAARDAGWGRHTDDLDVFARPVSARRLVKALAAQGAKTFWITDSHAVAWLDEDNAATVATGEAPAVRVDVLSTVTEPEASAIRTAIPAQRLGVPLRVFHPDHLAAIKFLAGRPKDLLDFDELVHLGVDTARVRYLVATADDTRVAALMARGRRLKTPRGVRDGSAKYLDREGFARAFAAALAAQRGAS